MSEERYERAKPEEAAAEAILMESGSIGTAGEACGECRVNRGMPAISTDGHEVGWVAAVALDRGGHSTGVLVARPHTTLEYYLVPLSMIGGVNEGHVLLRIGAEAALSLPRRVAGSMPLNRTEEDLR